MRWPRSFRTRVVVLVALLTALAIGVTVWVTVAATSQTITDSAQARQQDLNLIAGQLKQYAVEHGTWIGVPVLADRLQAQTGQRIKLTTEAGEVIVDTDTEQGVTARPPSSTAPVALVPRPAFTLQGVDGAALGDATLGAISGYRQDAALAACLTAHGYTVAIGSVSNGIPRLAVSDTDVTSSGCAAPAVDPVVSKDDVAAVTQCGSVFLQEIGRTPPTAVETASAAVGSVAVGAREQNCLTAAFQARTADVGAVTLLLYTGVRGTSVVQRDTHRILYATIPVLVLALAVAVLLARRAIRPIDAVIRASARFAAGDRATRVRVRGHDEMADLAASFNDMAASVQRSEEQQRSMVADVAHELRTPLANIRGYVEALRDGVLPPSTEVFESLHEEALLQQRVIDDLQDLALADRHGLIARRVPTDVAELVRTVRAAYAVRSEAAGVSLRVEADGPVPADVDPDRLRQAVGNLVTNALRATPDGGSVTLRAGLDGTTAVVEVEDTGHGIAVANLGRVFDRFWRDDPSRARSTGGSGLGLAITREIVRGHGGTIDVRSTEGTGTVFTLRIPPR